MVTWKIFKYYSYFQKEKVCLLFYASLTLVKAIFTGIIAEIDHTPLELWNL